MLDSLVRVSRRVGSHRAGAPSWPASPSQGGRGRTENTVLGPGRSKLGTPPAAEAIGRTLLARPESMVRAGVRASPTPAHGRYDSLASNDFTYCFTFFSKSFSSFPHGTCSLSVSHKCLALEGRYLPLRAAVPSSTTHGRVEPWGEAVERNGAVTLRGAPSQKRLSPNSRRVHTQDYNSTRQQRAD